MKTKVHQGMKIWQVLARALGVKRGEEFVRPAAAAIYPQGAMLSSKPGALVDGRPWHRQGISRVQRRTRATIAALAATVLAGCAGIFPHGRLPDPPFAAYDATPFVKGAPAITYENRYGQRITREQTITTIVEPVKVPS